MKKTGMKKRIAEQCPGMNQNSRKIRGQGNPGRKIKNPQFKLVEKKYRNQKSANIPIDDFLFKTTHFILHF
jgi:hypothetical protein